MSTFRNRVLSCALLAAVLCFAAQRYSGHGNRRHPLPTPRREPDEILIIRRKVPPSGHAGCLALAREAAAGSTGRNFIVSPLSIHAALALVAAGAKGDTRRQLLEFLGSPSLEALHGAPETELVRELNGMKQTSFACGVWVDRRRALRPEFMAIGASRYAAVAESVDFVTDTEQARRRVNAFVRDATNNLIDDVLAPGPLLQRDVVRAAVRLVGDLPRALSHPGRHHRARAVPDVLRRGRQAHRRPPRIQGPQTSLREHNGDGVRRLAAAFYMLLLLPDNNSTNILELSDLYWQAVSTPGFIKNHTPVAKVPVGQFIKNHTPVAKVPVGQFMVPKFKFTFEFEASSDMRKLGLTKPFDGGDFSGMLSSDDELCITGVYHKATIEVNELGTMAVAATAILLDGSSARIAPAPRRRVDFVADRPFLFTIEERSSTVMFLGHVVNPLDH
ncbi:hypothetical protein BRADI_4g23040v3 [Brachypodium distachyon]|uniref:Serpin domain-containing protein n=1 Tax=Brachypodium distachyon TaxID=15368 RepID=I1IMQ2_BRADI|nr:hypothetical protein BRADI_4g23040v3 [Brachypodium distachyon]